ncbi:hypothetical protein [Anoxybacillus gonensis]|uniref:hypothetical protein n=1 Tax=Anoxybacillus gonensis TaxID=198467 RepID=UPI0002BFCFE8|nr:hypothetical protein [Anoxybacillus gonensis]EMI10387.1 hypothetical protein F510_1694 [Anoxybacillus gonensis]
MSELIQFLSIQFLKELDELSRKYGIYIEVGENSDGITLVNEDLDVIAVVYLDKDTQEYLVREDILQ